MTKPIGRFLSTSFVVAECRTPADASSTSDTVSLTVEAINNKGTSMAPRLIVIVAEAGSLRQGLLGLLSSVESVVVMEAGSVTEGLGLIAEYRPAAVIVDLGLPDDAGWEVLRLAGDLSVHTRRLALVNEVSEISKVIPFVHRVVLKGCAPTEMLASISDLLDESYQ